MGEFFLNGERSYSFVEKKRENGYIFFLSTMMVGVGIFTLLIGGEF